MIGGKLLTGASLLALENEFTENVQDSKEGVTLLLLISLSCAPSHLILFWKTSATLHEDIWSLCFLNVFLPKKSQAVSGDSQTYNSIFSS